MLTYKYTVLLLVPDYAANNYGEDTYLAHVEAANPAFALLKAQQEAAAVHENASDYRCLLTVAGHHDDLSVT